MFVLSCYNLKSFQNNKNLCFSISYQRSSRHEIQSPQFSLDGIRKINNKNRIDICPIIRLTYFWIQYSLDDKIILKPHQKQPSNIEKTLAILISIKQHFRIELSHQVNSIINSLVPCLNQWTTTMIYSTAIVNRIDYASWWSRSRNLLLSLLASTLLATVTSTNITK